METKQVPKIEVSAKVQEAYVNMAKLVRLEYGQPHTYGMDLDTITKLRLLKAIDPEFAPTTVGGRYTPEEWAEVVQSLKYGSNANAVNNRLQESKDTKKATLVGEYANIV